MTDRSTENAMTLASLLGGDVREAARLLDISIAVTFDPADRVAAALAAHLRALLARTVSIVQFSNGHVPAAEVVVGAARPCLSRRATRVAISPDATQVGTFAPAVPIWPDCPPIILVVAACYAAGMALKVSLGPRLAVGGPSPDEGLRIPTAAVIGADPTWVLHEFELADTYLAGAGAIGNGFLYALSHLRASGSLVVVDPDYVSAGNLNRCVWFSDADIDRPKATRLVQLASPRFPRLALVSKVATLQEVGKQQAGDTWLKRLIVGVDSRRARRRLQSEIPREVFDASTTGVAECVLHHHQQPTDDACLACVYHETNSELTREQHIAEALGVELSDVKEHHVSADAARRIHARYSDRSTEQIEGQAYDSLFKALCAEGNLLTTDNKQVLAPFAFVSVLAGAYLAIELARRLILGPTSHTFNYWRVSPWAAPFEELKQVLPRHASCEFCGQPVLLRTAQTLWAAH